MIVSVDGKKKQHLFYLASTLPSYRIDHYSPFLLWNILVDAHSMLILTASNLISSIGFVVPTF